MRIYISLVMMTMKSRMQYPLILFLDMLSSTMMYLADFLVIYLFAKKVGGINGWGAEDIIFLQVLVVTASTLDSFISRGLTRFSKLELLSGNFDTKLVRPVNPLVILLGNVNLGGLSIVFFLLVVLPILNAAVPHFFSFYKFMWMIPSVVGGVIIFTSLKIISAAIGFWTFDSESFYRITKIGTRKLMWYPLSIYPKILQVILCTVLPLGFVSYMPAHIVVEKSFSMAWFLPYLTLPVGLIFLSFAVLLWNRGIRQYEGSGA